MSGHGTRRTQNVGSVPNQGSVMGEAGRVRPTKFTPPEGMRAVTVYSGPRDNFEETSAVYLDEDGPFAGEVAHESASKTIIVYPEANFTDHQKAAEDFAMARVQRAAPVEDASISQNTVTTGTVDTLEGHMRAAGEGTSNFDQ